MTGWNVLLRDHHPGYISWEQYEANQKLISENAHMLPRTASYVSRANWRSRQESNLDPEVRIL